jgi:hypothetical protein
MGWAWTRPKKSLKRKCERPTTGYLTCHPRGHTNVTILAKCGIFHFGCKKRSDTFSFTTVKMSFSCWLKLKLAGTETIKCSIYGFNIMHIYMIHYDWPAQKPQIRKFPLMLLWYCCVDFVIDPHSASIAYLLLTTYYLVIEEFQKIFRVGLCQQSGKFDVLHVSVMSTKRVPNIGFKSQ